MRWILVFLHKKWRKKDGEVLALYLILYSGARIIVEFWRGDLIRGAVGPFSTSQFIGLFTLAAGIIIFAMRRKNRDPENTGEVTEQRKQNRKGRHGKFPGEGEPVSALPVVHAGGFQSYEIVD